MKKTKIIKKEELDFDLSKVKSIEKVDVFDDKIEIIFLLKEDG